MLRSLSRRSSSLCLGLALAMALGCASTEEEGRGAVILDSSPIAPEMPTEPLVEGPGVPQGPLTLPAPPLDDGEVAYRIVLETSGDRETFFSDEMKRRPDPSRDSHLLELEYRQIPVPAESEGASRLVLDALHYKLLGRNPDNSQEVEAGSDRLRLMKNEKVVVDIEGTAPKEALTPRKLLYRPFALISYNDLGNLTRYQPQGQRSVRNFLKDMPVRAGIYYATVPLPDRPVVPGDKWTARRYPPNLAGALGLSIEVEYSLAGFGDVEGVPCAWLLLSAETNAEDVPSAAGFAFNRVVASLSGEAWLELDTSRVRKLILEDVVRVSYERGEPPEPVTVHRMRYRTRLFKGQRDPGDVPIKWEDGTERFEHR